MASEMNRDPVYTEADLPPIDSPSEDDLLALIPDMELLESSTLNAIATHAAPKPAASKPNAAPTLKARAPVVPGRLEARSAVTDDPYADLMPDLEPFDDTPAPRPSVPAKVAAVPSRVAPAAAPVPPAAPVPRSAPPTRPAAAVTPLKPVAAKPAPKPTPGTPPTVNPAPSRPAVAPAKAAAVARNAAPAPDRPATNSVKIPNPNKVVVPPVMDREFILRNRIVELYLAGSLPLRSATVFEQFCRENPQIMDEIGLADRVHKGLTLLEAGGKPEPWQEKPKKPWEQPYLLAALGVLVLALAVTALLLNSHLSAQTRKVTALQQQLQEQPIEAAASSTSVDIQPSRFGPAAAPSATLGGASAQLATIKLNMTHSDFRAFRVTIDRANQGRVAILNNLIKDSNGELGFSLNTSALGPGSYQFTIEGLDWRGDPQADSWAAVQIRH